MSYATRTATVRFYFRIRRPLRVASRPPSQTLPSFGEPDTAKLADLLGFLSREYTAARDGLHAALLANIETRP